VIGLAHVAGCGGTGADGGVELVRVGDAGARRGRVVGRYGRRLGPRRRAQRQRAALASVAALALLLVLGCCHPRHRARHDDLARLRVRDRLSPCC
jgi:hypothetical protein